MSHYVDGFVLPLPKDKVEEYRAIAEKASKVWLEHGALEYRECVGDDLNIEGMVPFPKIAAAGEADTVVFAYIVYNSKEHRDEVNAKVMADPRLTEMGAPDNMPFDCSKMAYGGFKTVVYAKA
jgi:uncharacterized protein YbaA (DUF1428 family)